MKDTSDRQPNSAIPSNSTMDKASGASRDLARTYEALKLAQKATSTVLPHVSLAITDLLQTLAEPITESVQVEIWTGLRRLADALEQWYRDQKEDLKSTFETLETHGWFPDPAMSMDSYSRLAGEVDNDPDAVARSISVWLQERLDDIEEQLVRSYPERAHILQDAFEAHRENKWTLSVPVFLIQAEGIFHDRVSKRLYAPKQRSSAVQGVRTQPENALLDVFLHPLTVMSPVWKPEGKLGKTFEGLNRHEVLHGKAVDFGTETNSLKAISLLRYLDWILGITTPGPGNDG